ncbi:hypothetical protein EJ04DRAFT_402945, partial [Polyplosphaeria fusca]
SNPPAGNTLLTFSLPRIPLELALHRRADEWYLVFPRGYGMAEGRKLVAQLNGTTSSPSSSTHDPPRSNSNLNPRFWFRDGSDWEDEQNYFGLVGLEDVLGAEREILRDTGLRRRRMV